MTCESELLWFVIVWGCVSILLRIIELVTHARNINDLRRRIKQEQKP